MTDVRKNTANRISRAGRIFLPVILAVWPLVNAGQGIDLADVTYSLGNYRYLGRGGTGSAWFFATYLANRVGAFFGALGGNGSMLFMNICCSLLLSLAVLFSFFYFRKKTGDIPAFLALFLAESLYWMPSVILYNNLSYFLLTGAMLLMYAAADGMGRGSTDERKMKLLLAAAGICLGMNVTVRLSNLTQCILIFALWYLEVLEKRSFSKAASDTFCCIGGFLAGFGLILADIAARYGAGPYFGMIPQVLAMSSSASDYTLASMMRDTLNAYLHAGRYGLMLILYAVFLGAADLVLGRMPVLRKFPRRAVGITGIAGGLFVFAVLLRWLYGHGMFNFVYADYWCMFQWAMVLVLVMYLFFLAALADGKVPVQEKFRCAAAVLIFLAAPLGSNNYTFPVLLTLPAILPVFAQRLENGGIFAGRHAGGSAAAVSDAAGEADRIPGMQGSFRKAMRHGFCLTLCLTMIVLFGQSALFHVNFAFGDGTDGTPRSAEVTDVSYLKGIRTTPQRAQEIEELFAAAEDLRESGRIGTDTRLITIGNAPGLHLILDMDPALSNTWTDLDSYSSAEVKAELEELDTEPVLIERLGTAESVSFAEKREMLEKFMESRGYEEAARTGSFVIYAPPGE